MAAKDRHILAPSAQGWQLWSPPSGGSGVAIGQPHDLDKPLRGGSRDAGPVVAIPAAQLFCLPLHLMSAENSLVNDLVRLQFEKRGILATSEADPILSVDVVVEGEKSAQICAVLLRNDLPENLLIEKASGFIASPYLYKFPANQLTLYREGDETVAVFTHDDKIAYFQLLTSSELDGNVATELHCLMIQLRSENIIDRCSGINFWLDASAEKQSAVASALFLKIQKTARATPMLPQKFSDLTPHEVTASRRASKQKRSVSKLVTALAAVYVIAVAALAANFILQQLKVNRLQADLAVNGDKVAMLRQAADRWNAVQPAIDVDQYPVERLLQAATLLPAEGVRFVLYEQKGTDLLISGEASNAQAAFRYADSLKRSDSWDGYQWSMPQPRLLANNSAKFDITGQLPSLQSSAPALPPTVGGTL